MKKLFEKIMMVIDPSRDTRFRDKLLLEQKEEQERAERAYVNMRLKEKYKNIEENNKKIERIYQAQSILRVLDMI